MIAKQPVILIRCDAGAKMGFGHVSRCMSLARALRDRRPCCVTFAVTSSDALGRIRQRGFNVELKPGGFLLDVWLEDILHELDPDVLVLDAPEGFPFDLAERSRLAGRLVAVLDDPGTLRLSADVVYYPPVPTVNEMDWQNAAGVVLSGFPWVVLGDGFVPQPPPEQRTPPTLLVTMGGSDPAGLSLRAVRILGDPMVRGMDWSTVIVLGPGFSRHEELRTAIAGMADRLKVLENPADMGMVMASCDLAFASFGVTAHELAAAGKPALHFCLTVEHARAADVFAREGMAVNLGLHGEVEDDLVALELAALISSPDRRARMGARAAERVDGKGAGRIAQDIFQRLDAKS